MQVCLIFCLLYLLHEVKSLYCKWMKMCGQFVGDDWQVDIFLRRAFFGTQQKVHCLAFADSLDYDVGEKAEKKIKEYVNSAGLTKVIYSLSMSDICIDDIDGKLLDV